MVAGYRAEWFRPQIELFAKTNDAYVGVDMQSKMLLAYPVVQGGHLFCLDEIRSWRILLVGQEQPSIGAVAPRFGYSGVQPRA